MLNDMGSPIDSIRSFLRHPLFIFLILGLVIRLVLYPLLEVGFDSDCWAMIIRNIQSGNGLYELEGYYYTPVWGYILSIVSVFQEFVFGIDVMGIKPSEVLPIDGYSWAFSSMVTSIAFNFTVKLPFLISDAIVGYLIYWLVKDKTGDTRKATIGFALWFLCPVSILISSVSGMFDSFAVMFTLLCIIMLRKDKMMLAGILFAFAILTKFFPIYLIFILIVYVLHRHKDDGKALQSVVLAAVGVVIGFLVIMIPQILEGTLSESILFVTTRMGGEDITTLFDTIVSWGATVFFAAMIVVSALIALHMHKKSEGDIDDSIFKYVLITVALLFLYPPLPQYIVLLIPFLVLYMVMYQKELKLSFILISIGSIIFVLAGNFSELLSFATFSDLMSLDYVMSMIEVFQTPLTANITPMIILFCVGGVIEYVGVLSVLITLYWKYRKDRALIPGSVADT